MTEIKPITSFRGDHFFLSNYDTEPFKLRGVMVPSGEHAFVWGKLNYLADPSRYKDYEYDLFNNCPTPQFARNLGKNVTINPTEWDKYSMWWMRELVHAKFTGVQGYAGRLINTGAAMLVEGNTWGDALWGRIKVNGQWIGLNLLGVILIEERGYWLHTDFGKDVRPR